MPISGSSAAFPPGNETCRSFATAVSHFFRKIDLLSGIDLFFPSQLPRLYSARGEDCLLYSKTAANFGRTRCVSYPFICGSIADFFWAVFFFHGHLQFVLCTVTDDSCITSCNLRKMFQNILRLGTGTFSAIGSCIIGRLGNGWGGNGRL